MALAGTTFELVFPFLLDLLSFLFQTLQSATRSRHQSGIKARAVRWPMRFQGPLLPEIDCWFSNSAWALLFHSRPEVLTSNSSLHGMLANK